MRRTMASDPIPSFVRVRSIGLGPVRRFADDKIGEATEDTETSEKKTTHPKLFSVASVLSVANQLCHTNEE